MFRGITIRTRGGDGLMGNNGSHCCRTKSSHHHLLPGSNPKTLVAAGKLTYLPTNSEYFHFRVPQQELGKPNKRTNRKKTILSTYFFSCQRLPWRWRPHLKAPFPLWLQHLGKGCQGNEAQANGRWRCWECNLPQDGVPDTYLHLHMCLNVSTFSGPEQEHQLQMNIKSQPFRKRNKSSLSEVLPACAAPTQLSVKYQQDHFATFH